MRSHRLARIICLTLVLVLLGAQSAFAIVPWATISGKVYRPNGLPLSSWGVHVMNASGTTDFANKNTGADGSYSATVTPGDYKVWIASEDATDLAWGFWTASAIVPLLSMGETVTVIAGQTRTIDATMPYAGAFEGTVTAHANGAGMEHAVITPYYRNPVTGLWEATPLAFGTDGASGHYTDRFLLPGTYRIGFRDTNTATRYIPQYWNGMPSLLSAAEIAVPSQQTVKGISAAMYVDVASETVAGPTRIDTAIDASKKMYPDATLQGHADAVIITNGYNWPDALGGSALAGIAHAPVLLNAAPPAAMPTQLDAEVVRLKNNGATEAYILGDTNAVSAAVETRLAAIFGGAANVHRLGATGHSRYATCLDIANEVKAKSDAGPGWYGTVFLAKGTDYPDALAASPLAAEQGWPIVLAESDGHGGLSPRVKAFLAANATSKVVILGSENAVPKAMADSAASVVGAGKIERWYGADRIGTAIDIADHSIALNDALKYDGVGIATAYGYADALCGGPYLAMKKNPLLLSADALPLREGLASKLPTLSPTVATVRFLGGTPALRQTVRDAIVDKLR